MATSSQICLLTFTLWIISKHQLLLGCYSVYCKISLICAKQIKLSSKFAIENENMLQLLGDFVPQTPYRGSAPGPRWGTSVPQTPSLVQFKIFLKKALGPCGRNLCSAGNPTLEPNITSIGTPVAKLWPICIRKMAVSRHLGFYRTGNCTFHIFGFQPEPR